MNRRIVYTCLIGDYEDLNEQEIASESEIDFVCLTDDPQLQSNSWKIERIKPTFAADPVRSQRTLKLLAHKYFPDHTHSLYIDNSVILKKRPEELFDRYLGPHKLAIPLHSERISLLDEFIAVAQLGMDDSNRVWEQLNHYSIFHPEILNQRPFWSAILFRNHQSQECNQAFELWHHSILRYSRRDQLSANLALQSLEGQIAKINIDNHSSDFHSWPHAAKRNSSRGWRRQLLSNMPSLALMRENELRIENQNLEIKRHSDKNQTLNREIEREKEVSLELQKQLQKTEEQLISTRAEGAKQSAELEHLKLFCGETEAKLNSVLNSKSWRITKGLRAFADQVRKLQIPAKEQTFVTCTNGRKMFVNPLDPRGVALMSCGGNLNPISLSIWQALVKSRPWDGIIEVGCNYGEMILNLDIPQHTKLILVEANPTIRKFLSRSLVESTIKAKIYAAAVSDKCGNALFWIDQKWSGTSHLVSNGTHQVKQGKPIIKIPSITLNKIIMDNFRYAESNLLLKLDVEGMEHPILKSSIEILTSLKSFQVLVESLHMNDQQLDWLRENFLVEGYNVKSHSLQKLCDISISELLSNDEIYGQDLVLSPKVMT